MNDARCVDLQTSVFDKKFFGGFVLCRSFTFLRHLKYVGLRTGAIDLPLTGFGVLGVIQFQEIFEWLTYITLGVLIYERVLLTCRPRRSSLGTPSPSVWTLSSTIRFHLALLTLIRGSHII